MTMASAYEASEANNLARHYDSHASPTRATTLNSMLVYKTLRGGNCVIFNERRPVTGIQPLPSR